MSAIGAASQATAGHRSCDADHARAGQFWVRGVQHREISPIFGSKKSDFF